ncbi:MAG TPA: hypothetical protein EYO59_05575 [Chromatiaceae bacterium]|nr:hypothetical protein [Chromatiaceae bacterium]
MKDSNNLSYGTCDEKSDCFFEDECNTETEKCETSNDIIADNKESICKQLINKIGASHCVHQETQWLIQTQTTCNNFFPITAAEYIESMSNWDIDDNNIYSPNHCAHDVERSDLEKVFDINIGDPFISSNGCVDAGLRAFKMAHETVDFSRCWDAAAKRLTEDIELQQELYGQNREKFRGISTKIKKNSHCYIVGYMDDTTLFLEHIDTDENCIQDCAGVYGGSAQEDPCGNCDDDPDNDCDILHIHFSIQDTGKSSIIQ